MSVGLWDRWRPSLKHVASSGTLPLWQQEKDDDRKVTKTHHARQTKNEGLEELSANLRKPCAAAPFKFVYLLRISRKSPHTRFRLSFKGTSLLRFDEKTNFGMSFVILVMICLLRFFFFVFFFHLPVNFAPKNIPIKNRFKRDYNFSRTLQLCQQKFTPQR